MAKRRRAAIDAHISGYTLPKFENSDWKELERIAGIKLNNVARGAVQDAANHFTEEALLQLDGAVRAEMVGQASAGRNQNKKILPLAAFRSSLLGMIDAWNAADQNPETARLLTDFAAENNFGPGGSLDFEKTRIDLDSMAMSLDQFLTRIDDQIVPIQDKLAKESTSNQSESKSLAEPFSDFVRKLADIVRGAGGSVTAPTWTVNSKRVSPFVGFAIRINESLPATVQQHHANEAAWSKAIARMLSA